MNMNKFMPYAIEEAFKAKSTAEIPVGAVIVKNGEIIKTRRFENFEKC